MLKLLQTWSLLLWHNKNIKKQIANITNALLYSLHIFNAFFFGKNNLIKIQHTFNRTPLHNYRDFLDKITRSTWESKFLLKNDLIMNFGNFAGKFKDRNHTCVEEEDNDLNI